MTDGPKKAPQAPGGSDRVHLHHHLSPRRERAMFATLGFTLALAVTRGITTLLHKHGAGANGGIIVGGVHIHHFVFGMVGLLLLGYLWLLLVGFEDKPPRRLFRLHGVRLRSLLGADPRRVRPLAQPARRLLGAAGPRERRGPLIFGGVLLWGALIWPFGLAVGVASAGSRPSPGRDAAPPCETDAMEAAQVSLLRWLRRQLRQPIPAREHLEAAVENDDVAEARRLLARFEFSDEQRRNVEQLLDAWERQQA